MAEERTGHDPGGPVDSVAIQNSPEFAALRKALRRFVFPATIAFLAWYALYVLLSTYAKDFMAIRVAGHINIGLIFGVLQFISTFLIAWAYSRYADRHLDPAAEAIKRHMEDGGPLASRTTKEDPA
jgi:uncharacterized membrane protein (DUF485 family)